MAQTYTNTPVLSKIKIGDQIYWVKDADVRGILDTYGTIVTYNVSTSALDVDDSIPNAGQIKAYIETQIAGLTGAMHFAGVVIREEGEDDLEALARQIPAAKSGDMAVMQDNKKEYVYDGTQWRELGDEGIYLTISAAEAAYVPKTATIAGIDLQDNITTDEVKTALGLQALAYKANATTTLTDYATGIEAADYTPAGTVAVTLSQTSTAMESTGNFTPAGTVSGTMTPAGTVSLAEDNENGIQITGTVSAPTVTVTPATTQITPVASLGTLPSYTPAQYTAPSETPVTGNFATAGVTAVMDGSDTEMLVITAASTGAAITSTGFNAGSYTGAQFNAGALPTFDTAVTVATGIQEASATAPTFTGGKFSATFAGTQGSINATFAGTQGEVTVSGNYDKAGVQTATFTGTEAEITPTLTTTSKEVTVQ